MKQKLNHINLFMNSFSSLLKKFRSILVIKKIEFGLYKQIRSVFICVKKSGFWRENLDLFLFNITVFWIVKKIQICF